MRQFLLTLACLAVHLAAALPVHAAPAEFCVDQARRWCLGTLAVKFHGGSVQVIQFNNDDILVEVTERERTERMLMRAQERRPTYFGLTPDEQRPGGVAFKFSVEGWALPLAALALAFPDGLTSVPVTQTGRNVDLGGELLVVNTWRLPAGDICFRIYKLGFAPPIIIGKLSSVRPAPLDEGTIAGWGPGVYVEPFARLKPMPDGK